MDYADWNRGLLLSELLIVIAGMSLVSARSPREALFAVGVLVQGIVMTFASGSAYFPRADFAIATIAMMAVFGLWCLWVNAPVRDPEAVAAMVSSIQAEETSQATGADARADVPGNSDAER